MLKRKKLTLLIIAIVFLVSVPTSLIASSRTNLDSLMIQSLLTSQLTRVGTISTKDGGNPLVDAGNTIATAMIITPGIYTDGNIDWLLDADDFYNISVPATGYTIYVSIDCYLNEGTDEYLSIALLNPDGQCVTRNLDQNIDIRKGLLYTLTSTDKTGYWTIQVHANYPSGGSYTLRVNVSPSQSITKPEAQWTFMSYMVAEDDRGVNGIGFYSMNDIAEMAGVGSTASVNIVALIDHYAGGINPYTLQTGTRIYYVDYEGIVWLSDYGDTEKNTGSYETLKDFINFVKTHFPAQHYALNLWNHGGGIKGVCWDCTDGKDNLNFTEIFWALNDTGGVDLLYYKACLVGIIENMYSIANLTDVIVTSEDSMYEVGDDYSPFLSNLKSNPSASAAQLGQWIVNAYSSFNPDLLSFAAVKSSEIANVYARLNETAKYLDIQTLNGTWRTTIIQTLDQVENFTYYDSSNEAGFFLIDLYHFVDKLAQNLNDAYLTTLSNNLKTAILNAIIQEAHGTDHPNAHGIAIYHPNTEGNYSKTYYTSMLFAIDNMWDEYLWHLLGHHSEHDTLDYDADGLANSQEYNLGTNAFSSDSDGDGMPDGWEVQYSLNPTSNDADQDPDGDGFTNLQEYLAETDPTNAFSRPSTSEPFGILAILLAQSMQQEQTQQQTIAIVLIAAVIGVAGVSIGWKILKIKP